MSSSKYWDAEDLLMSQEMLSTMTEEDIKGINFQDKVNGVGNFDAENRSNNLDTITREGSKLDVPLWFALILREYNFSSLNQPKYLTEKFYSQLQTDSTIVNFKLKNFYLYDIYLKLITFFDEEDKKWPKIIAETINKRFLFLMKNAANVIYENYSLTKIMCFKEKIFYDKMVKVNKNIKFFIENYENNNKNLDDIVDQKRMSRRTKKIK
jgi:hypothetical protein